MTDAATAARYLAYLCREDGGGRGPLPAKTHALLYLAQGWSYVWDGKPVFEGGFDAGAFGPVNADAAKAVGRGFDAKPDAAEGAARPDDEDAAGTLEATWREFGRKDGFSLSVMSRRGPWEAAYAAGTRISDEDVRDWFLRVHG